MAVPVNVSLENSFKAGNNKKMAVFAGSISYSYERHFPASLPNFNLDLFVTVGQMLQIIGRVHDERDIVSL